MRFLLSSYGRSPAAGVSLLKSEVYMSVRIAYHDSGVNDEQDTAARSESEHLGQESLVKGSKALLLGHCHDGRPCPVVLGGGACNLGAVLNSGPGVEC